MKAVQMEQIDLDLDLNIFKKILTADKEIVQWTTATNYVYSKN